MVLKKINLILLNHGDSRISFSYKWKLMSFCMACEPYWVPRNYAPIFNIVKRAFSFKGPFWHMLLHTLNYYINDVDLWLICAHAWLYGNLSKECHVPYLFWGEGNVFLISPDTLLCTL